MSFLTSYEPSSKMPSVASIVSIACRVSAVFALVTIFMFQHHVRLLLSFVSPCFLIFF